MDCCERFLSKWVPSWKRVQYTLPIGTFESMIFLSSRWDMWFIPCEVLSNSKYFDALMQILAPLLGVIRRHSQRRLFEWRLPCHKCVPNKYLPLSKTKGTLIASEKSTKAMMICPALEASVRFSDLICFLLDFVGWGRERYSPPKLTAGTWKSSRNEKENHLNQTLWLRVPAVSFRDMGVSKNRGTPKWMVYMENPIKNRWFGGTTI